MKIYCNKSEFAQMVINCSNLVDEYKCCECVLSNFCSKPDDIESISIVDLCEIITEGGNDL